MNATVSNKDERVLREASAFPKKLTEEQKMAASLIDRTARPGRGLRPDAYMPERECLRRLITGKLTDADRQGIADWTAWVHAFSGAMSQWENLWMLALEDHRKQHPNQPSLTLKSTLAKLTRLSAAAYAAYAPAVRECTEDLLTIGVEASMPAVFELANRYAEYLGYVEILLLDLWPDLSREVLFQPTVATITA